MIAQRIVVSTLLFLLLVSLSACGGADEGGDDRRRWGQASTVTPSVEAIQAEQGALPLEERLTGTVRADNQVIIYPEVSAPVVRVVAENGATVQAGDPLVYLRDVQFREQLRQAEATLRINKAEAQSAQAALRELQGRLERAEQLAGKQYQSEEELQTLRAQVDGAEAAYEQAQARIAQAEASVEQQREALRRTVVRAPISGRVGQRNVEVGMRADPNSALYTIGNLDKVRVMVSITDEMIGRVQEGQTAVVTAESMDNWSVDAKVSRISPFLQAQTYSAAAEIDVQNTEGQLRPGMFVTVDVLYGEAEQATLIPTSALYEDPNTGALGVFVGTTLGTEVPLEMPESYDENNPPPLTQPTPMEFREVDVLARGRGLVGVTNVRPGDWVVTVGQNLLRARGDATAEARVRPITWTRIAELQEMQDQDLLRDFMEKQQRLAREAQETSGSTEEAPPTAAQESVKAPAQASF